MQHVKKRSCSRAIPDDFYNLRAREKIRPDEIVEKIWREKAPSLKDAFAMGKKDLRVDAYIAKSADFAKPIHATATTHEGAVWVPFKTRNLQSLSPAGPSPPATDKS